mgnify:CR=1 FL=1
MNTVTDIIAANKANKTQRKQHKHKHSKQSYITLLLYILALGLGVGVGGTLLVALQQQHGNGNGNGNGSQKNKMKEDGGSTISSKEHKVLPELPAESAATAARTDASASASASSNPDYRSLVVAGAGTTFHLPGSFFFSSSQQKEQQQEQEQKQDRATDGPTDTTDTTTTSTSTSTQFSFVSNTDMTMIQVEQFTCSDLLENFTETIWIEWSPITTSTRSTSSSTPTNLDKLNETLQTELESILLHTYNDLSFSLCDAPYFRTLAAVDVQETPADYSQYSLLQVNLTAECHNCTYPFFQEAETESWDSWIFASENATRNNDNETTEMATTSISNNVNNANVNVNDPFVSVSKQQSPAAAVHCVCPVQDAAASATGNASVNTNDTTLERKYRAPTVTEFQVALTSNLNNFLPFQGTNITNIYLQQPTKTTTVPCSSNIVTFTSYVYFDIDVVEQTNADNRNAAAVSVQQRLQLEQTFVETYNLLSYLACDRYFRSVTTAVLDAPATTTTTSSDQTRERRKGRRLQQVDDNDDIDVLTTAWNGNSTIMTNNNYTNTTMMDAPLLPNNNTEAMGPSITIITSSVHDSDRYL